MVLSFQKNLCSDFLPLKFLNPFCLQLHAVICLIIFYYLEIKLSENVVSETNNPRFRYPHYMSHIKTTFSIKIKGKTITFYQSKTK